MTEVHPLQWAVDGPPVGKWLTCMGTLDVPMQSLVVICSDGTGSVSPGNALGFGPADIEIRWRHSPGVLTVFQRFLGHGADDEVDQEDPEDPDNWMECDYEADWFDGRVRTPVIQDRLRENSPRGPGFAWLTIAPIRYAGPPD